MEAIKSEEVGWSYVEFDTTASSKIEDSLLLKPLTNKEEIEKCFVLTSTLKKFMDGFKYRNYLFLSPPGTGKTSFLSYLSLKAAEDGRRPLWLAFYENVPETETFFKRLKMESKESQNYILIFDNIHLHPDLFELLLEITRRFPHIPLWCTAHPYNFLKLKKEWSKVGNFFSEEEVPSFLQQEDLKKIMAPLDKYLTPKEKEIILSHFRLPVIHLVSIWRELKERPKGKTILSSIKQLKIGDKGKEETPLEIKKVYRSMYDSLDDDGRFALKLLAFVGGIQKDLLTDCLETYGLSKETVDRLIKGQIVYPASTYRIAPNFQTVSVLDAFDELKRIVAQREITFKYEEEVFLDILLNVASNEALFVLFENFDLLSPILKKNYLSLLIKRKDELPLLWLASNLAEKEKELLVLGDYALKKSEEEIVDESISRILYNFGYAFGISGKNEEAIKYYLRSAKAYEDDERTWYNLGLAYQKIGNIIGAKQAYQKATQINPDYPKAYSALGSCSLEDKDAEEAVRLFKKAVKLKPNSALDWYRLGLALVMKKDRKEAISSFKKAVELDKENFLAHFRLGLLYEEEGKIEEAASCFGRCVDLNPKDPDTYQHLSRLANKANDMGKTLAYHEKAMALIAEVGSKTKGEPSLEEASSYEKIKKIDAKDAKAWQDLALFWIGKGKIDKGIQYLKRSVTVAPQDASAWYNLGLAYSQKKEFSKEIESYEKAIALNPGNERCYFNLGLAFRDKGEPNKEMECYQRVLEINPANIAAWHNLSCSYAEIDDLKEEKRCLTKENELREIAKR